ncbi:hypothetical protein [Leucobacter luti]|uniref:Uncharacterized protein n=1 Tax=Leucobacter luti TaxID=340320 RepID=A0A4V6MD41_9MICO|nr:hypothetical protein [Leucobacter luti]MBL3699248.1 hypothetical protein [Leucobacter luti]RZT66749.1 hypothetical protein EV139_0876 [Leucobacter luti]
MCTNGRCTFESTGAHLAGSYQVDSHKLTIDSEALPWLLAEGGPQVESIGHDEWMHILWVPILVESPMIPSITEPPGETVYSHLTPTVGAGDHVAQHQMLGHTGGSTQIVVNETGKPEPILTSEDWGRVNGE